MNALELEIAKRNEAIIELLRVMKLRSEKQCKLKLSEWERAWRNAQKLVA